MHKTSVAAFFATVLVAVPAGWQMLTADIQSDGPGLRPPKESFEIDGVTVSVAIDRGISTARGEVKAILVATSDTPKEISLDVRALEDNGYGEERVANPPTVISKQRVKIKSGPNGGEPVELAFKLGTTRYKGSVQWFDIDVMSSKTKYIKNPDIVTGEGPNDARYWDDEDRPANAARVGFAVWGGNSLPIAFAPTKIPATGSFEIGVIVKNTTKKPIDWMQVELGNQLGLDGLSSELAVSAYGEESPYQVEAIENDFYETPLDPGKERTYRFKVTPQDEAARSFTFMAHAHGGGGGAVEVMTLQRPAVNETPTVVGLKK
jgi:hypothetical protein